MNRLKFSLSRDLRAKHFLVNLGHIYSLKYNLFALIKISRIFFIAQHYMLITDK